MRHFMKRLSNMLGNTFSPTVSAKTKMGNSRCDGKITANGGGYMPKRGQECAAR